MEFKNEALALYAVRYLNNMELAGKNRGLIVDFAMEDAKALFKRKEKIERHRKMAKESKKEEQEAAPATTPKKSEPLDLGKMWRDKIDTQGGESVDKKAEAPKKLSRG